MTKRKEPGIHIELDPKWVEEEMKAEAAMKVRFDEAMKGVDGNDQEAVFNAFMDNFDKIFGGKK